MTWFIKIKIGRLERCSVIMEDEENRILDIETH